MIDRYRTVGHFVFNDGWNFQTWIFILIGDYGLWQRESFAPEQFVMVGNK
jgi:hypothetical protein